MSPDEYNASDWDDPSAKIQELGIFVYEITPPGNTGEFLATMDHPSIPLWCVRWMFIDDEFRSRVSFPYLRGTTDNPVHVDRFPSKLRRVIKAFRIDKVSFSECRTLQLLEHSPCVFFDEATPPIAYLGSDCKTVKYLPGQEDEFLSFCQEFNERYPGQATLLHFEQIGMKQPSNPPTRRRTRDRRNK